MVIFLIGFFVDVSSASMMASLEGNHIRTSGCIIVSEIDFTKIWVKHSIMASRGGRGGGGGISVYDPAVLCGVCERALLSFFLIVWSS